MANTNRPLGALVADPTPAPRPSRITLKGRTVTLEPIQESHAESLFPHISGTENAWLWDYLPNEPVADVGDLRCRLAAQAKSEDPLFWTIKVHVPSPPPTTSPSSTTSAPDWSSGADPSSSSKAVGYVSFLNITPAHRSIEVGNVMYSTALQQTTAATEVIYLLARYAFRDLGYRRLEWKCNSLNEPSKRAATRYGFTFEGVFQQHNIVKGRNRDTTWFSLLDSEWVGGKEGKEGRGGIESAFEKWLDPSNFDAQGKQKRKLEDYY